MDATGTQFRRRKSLERRRPPVELRTLPTWATRERTTQPSEASRDAERLVAQELVVFPYLGPRRAVRPDLNRALLIIRGDVTRLKVGTVVYTLEQNRARQNAGILGPLHAGAGPALARELASKSCEPGDVLVTQGYNLNVDSVLHASLPRRPLDDLLRSCYEATFELAQRLRMRSVAFTPIGVGAGLPYSPVQAAHVALSSARDWLEKRGANLPPQDRVVFCFADDDEMEVYTQLAPYYFPLEDGDSVQDDLDENELIARNVSHEVRTRYRAKGTKAAERIKQIFKEWDKDGNGTISKKELVEVLGKLCPKLQSDSIDRMFMLLDADGSGEVDVEEFVAWLYKQ